MYAIIRTGCKQYRVQQGDEFRVEKLDAQVGDTVVFDEVVAVGGDKFVAGTPLVEGCAVTAEVLEQGKAGQEDWSGLPFPSPEQREETGNSLNVLING